MTDVASLPAPQDDEKTFAMIAHLSVFVFPIWAPLIIWFLKKEQSKFVAYHAVQAGIFQIALFAMTMVLMVVGNIVLAIFTAITFGLGGLCYPLLCLVFLPVFASIPFALKAKNGDWAGYPGIGGFGLPAPG